MKTLEDFHDTAMELAEQGDEARTRGQVSEAHEFFGRALTFEKAALALAPPEIQPTYAVLLRSAAALAMAAGELDEARDLLKSGLVEARVPAPLREELEELWESLESRMSSCAG